MTAICGSDIDYHTIKNGKDVYLCKGHDDPYHNAEGQLRIKCAVCNRDMSGYWDQTSNNIILLLLCDSCDIEKVGKILEELY